ncbi:hypothetical protein [Streptomyces griseorubiginosus]|uniref:hypothetical protein n=1 Tax=Streptomyces griseorubiginosus TaxID=67304 RepID=UPI002E810B06|nr:hypothetical protein [Streptomyces griseorubiginosus]WUB48070.1 hypothetical protein OHN19_33890 [Streptomyces griseorubiginosus]WUB56595.1 hypothetical protein OG942_33900 [Streptomyces griseorubiginosus]
MRLSRSLASVTAAVCLVMSPPYDAMPHTRVQAREAAPPEPFGASCRSRVAGSRVISYCHNPYPRTDGVRLHIECARWWDLDSDGPEVEAGPAQTVRLTGRCWKEVRSVWISHRKLAL